MIIKRGGREYFIPGDKTALQDGVWTGITHKELLPIEIKLIQDEIYDLTQEPMPTDEELLEFAKMEHPIAKQHFEAEEKKNIRDNMWDQYVLASEEAGTPVDNGMPEYGGMPVDE